MMRIPEEKHEAIDQRLAALLALYKICSKIGTEVCSSQLTSELAMVDYGSDFIYAGLLVYIYGNLWAEERILSYFCIRRSVHVEPV